MNQLLGFNGKIIYDKDNDWYFKPYKLRINRNGEIYSYLICERIPDKVSMSYTLKQLRTEEQLKIIDENLYGLL